MAPDMPRRLAPASAGPAARALLRLAALLACCGALGGLDLRSPRELAPAGGCFAKYQQHRDRGARGPTKTRRPKPPRPVWRRRPQQEDDDEAFRAPKPRERAISDANRALLDRLRRLDTSGDEGQEQARGIVSELLGERSLNRTREYSEFMSTLGRQNLWQESLALLADRTARGEEPNVQVLTAMMEGLATAKQWPRAVAMLRDMLDRGPAPSMATYNFALSACERAKEWQQALSLLDEMQESRRRDLFTFETAIRACAQGRQWERAIDLVDEMLRWDITPTWETYNLVLVLMAMGKQWEVTLELLEDMWRREIVPDSTTYGAALDVLEACDRWEEATQLLGEMRRKGFAPDASSYGSAVRACRACGQDAAAEALEREMQVLGLPVPKP